MSNILQFGLLNVCFSPLSISLDETSYLAHGSIPPRPDLLGPGILLLLLVEGDRGGPAPRDRVLVTTGSGITDPEKELLPVERGRAERMLSTY